MKDFHNLDVWVKAHTLALAVYAETRSFPPEERYGLTSQLRRAVVSVPANIAEGCGRDGDAELARFLRIAAGSASEVEYFLRLARDLNYVNGQRYKTLNSQTTEVKRMLARLVQRVTQ